MSMLNNLPGDDEDDATWRDSDDDESQDEGGSTPRERPGRFDHERWLRRLDFVLQRHQFPTQRSFQRFFESEIHTREARELDEPLSIEEEAQELAFLGLEAEDDAAAENYARDAIALDPDCVDARVLLAFFVTDELDEQIWLLERAVDCGRWRFESARTGDPRDHYLQRLEAKPLQRALHSLSESLIEAGEETEAEKLLEECSQLPHEDEDQTKYLHVVFLVRTRRLVKARSVLEKMPADDLARGWLEVLERFLSNERDEAANLLRDLRPRNFWIEQYLSGDLPLPKDGDRAALSDEQDDAIWVAEIVRPAFGAHPDALVWIRGVG
jgi:hypothetical protein